VRISNLVIISYLFLSPLRSSRTFISLHLLSRIRFPSPLFARPIAFLPLSSTLQTLLLKTRRYAADIIHNVFPDVGRLKSSHAILPSKEYS